MSLQSLKNYLLVYLFAVVSSSAFAGQCEQAGLIDDTLPTVNQALAAEASAAALPSFQSTTSGNALVPNWASEHSFKTPLIAITSTSISGHFIPKPYLFVCSGTSPPAQLI